MRTLLIAVLLVAMAISLKIDHECGIYNPNLPLPDQAIHSAEKTDISEDKLKEIQKFLEKSDPQLKEAKRLMANKVEYTDGTPTAYDLNYELKKQKDGLKNEQHWDYTLTDDKDKEGSFNIIRMVKAAQSGGSWSGKNISDFPKGKRIEPFPEYPNLENFPQISDLPGVTILPFPPIPIGGLFSRLFDFGLHDNIPPPFMPPQIPTNTVSADKANTKPQKEATSEQNAAVIKEKIVVDPHKDKLTQIVKKTDVESREQPKEGRLTGRHYVRGNNL